MVYSRYHYVAKVTSLRSISKTTQRLYIPQPTFTRAINNSEKELGVTLLNRFVTPPQLIYAGERYLEEAKRVLSVDESLRKELQEISEVKRGSLLIGANYAASALWLPHIFPVFRKEYLGIKISISQQTSPLFGNDLLKGNIDLASTT